MAEPQHTVKVRINKQIVDVACPPFASTDLLDYWMDEIKTKHPDWVIVSKSWRSDGPRS